MTRFLIQEKSNETWQGFGAAIDLVLDLLDNYESNELAKLSVYDFIEILRSDIYKKVDSYKKDS